MLAAPIMFWTHRSHPELNPGMFLSEEQKRDILYNNAARFLRLSKEQIERHHKQ